MMEAIYKHASKEAPRECCGLVVQDGNNEKYIPLENISEIENQFKIDPKTFVKYQLISKIKYVVHSHYDSKCNPSQHDIDNCNSVGIPFLIVSYPDKDYCIVEPK